MHPEIESEIRKNAEDFIEDMRKFNHPYALAEKVGCITNDDLYFLGIVDGSGLIAFTGLVDTGNTPEPVRDLESGSEFVMLDDADFKANISERQYKLVSQLYDCNPDEARDRWDMIHTKIDENYHGRGN